MSGPTADSVRDSIKASARAAEAVRKSAADAADAAALVRGDSEPQTPAPPSGGGRG